MRMTPPIRYGYAAATASVRTERGAEYAAFARATAGLKGVDESDVTQFPALARAVHDNQRLWGALADDLLLESNALPAPLRAQLLGLAEFVRRHSGHVLAGRASVAPLVDINTSIMRGLRGAVEVAA
jgi:flagellar biosynthesis activator protein FlaF